MILPRRPVPGEPVTAQLIGRMIDYMRRITPLRGNGVLTQATPGGTVISALPFPAAPAGVGPFPYEVQAVDVPGTGGSAAQTVLAIYTPQGVLCVDDSVVASIDTATAVASQGDGWYSYSGVVPPAAGQTTEIWLTVTWPASTGSVSARISTGTGSGSSSGDEERILLAKVARASSGGLSIIQYVYSALGFWRPVDEVTPDGVSTEFVPPAAQGQPADPDEGLLQVKGWKAGSPVSQTTLSADMSATGATGHVVFRNANGGMEYKPLGQIQTGGGSGLTGTVEFVADCDWYVNGSTHQLRKRLRILNLATGQVSDKPNTTYANGWEVLCNTTPISSIINQS